MTAKMDTTTELESSLRDTLGHLYDPSYLPRAPLWSIIGCVPTQGFEPIRAEIISAIERLRPTPHVPSNTRSWRLYNLLYLRYIQNLTSEETAQRLNITSRHLRREQQEAIAVLARHLTALTRDELATAEAVLGARPERSYSPDRHTQLHQELASLQRSAPGSLANVSEVLRGALDLGQILTAKQGVALLLAAPIPRLNAVIHPSALCQALVTTISLLLENMSCREITMSAKPTAQGVTIGIAGRPIYLDRPTEASFIAEILSAQGGSLDIQAEADCVTFGIKLLLANEITVLVVDDNPDMVHFYRRYVSGSRYRIIEENEGQRALEAAATGASQIIVLDVMLPDMDGWQLLSQLHTHPTTRDLPIIVCSVIRQAQLALALGAAQVLSKPVSRSEFLQALDQVAR